MAGFQNASVMSSDGSLTWMSIMHRVLEYIAESIAVSTNTILVYLIMTEHKKDYRDYRRVLLLNCIVDYLCTFVGIFLQPHFEILGGQWIYILSEPLIFFPRSVHMFFGGWYAWSNSFGITTIPIQFLFRKRLICDDEKLSVWDLLRLTGISFTSSCFCGFLFVSCFVVSSGKYYPASMIIDSGLISADEVDNLLNAEMTSVPMILLTLMAAVSDTVVFALVLRFSYQIYTKLNVLRKDMHPKTRKMQSQMNRMLAVQTISAFSVGVVPMLFLILIMATRINIIGAGTIISIFLAFVPAVNPVCTLVLVGEFRRRFMNMIRMSPISNTAVVSDRGLSITGPRPVFSSL